MNKDHTSGSSRHAGSCNCPQCRTNTSASSSNPYPHWKERRQQRLNLVAIKGGNHPVGCACNMCRPNQEMEYNDDDPSHNYWRRRRQLRHGWDFDDLELLAEIPIHHFVNVRNEPVPSLPVVKRYFEPLVQSEWQQESGSGGSVRVTYVYLGPSERERLIKVWEARRNTLGGNKKWAARIEKTIQSIRNCGVPYHWRISEEDVHALYRRKYPGAVQQRAFGDSKPDISLPPAARSIAGMTLRSRELELELVEVKRYNPQNASGLIQKLKDQVAARAKNAPHKGKYQTIILDFRGREENCDTIRRVADDVAKKLHESVPGVTLLVQVMLWRDCSNKKNCQR